VARAKRTDRAEARRKYRAYLQAQEEAAIAEAREEGEPAAQAAPRGAHVRDERPVSTPVPGVRMGMMAAARAAYRTPTYVSDIRNIRSLVLGSNAIWPVLVACVLGGAYMSLRIAAGGASSDPILPFVYQFIFSPPVPLLPVMLAGFLAPRATWLAGMIAAFIATVTLVVVVGLNVGSFSNTTGEIAVATPTPAATAAASPGASAGGSAEPSAIASIVPSATPAVSSSPAGSPAASAASSGSPAAGASTNTNTGKSNSNTVGDLFSLAIQLLIQSLGFGAIIGALSGWYKRFLALTSGGPRKPPASRQNRARPTQRRRPATR
jgi:hypothetical protein